MFKIPLRMRGLDCLASRVHNWFDESINPLEEHRGRVIGSL